MNLVFESDNNMLLIANFQNKHMQFERPATAMVECCKAFTAYSHPNIWNVGSNPSRNMGYVCNFTFVVVVCGYRLSNGLIPRSRSPTECLK
jgi:hypothetical protein